MNIFSNISEAFSSGGFAMWAILLLQVVSIAIIVERVVALYFRRRLNQCQFAGGFESAIRRGDLSGVQKELAGSKEPLARAMMAGVNVTTHLGGRAEVQGKMDEVLLEENSAIEKSVGFLAMLANVGTLTGLLGTIVGMIKSFSAVSNANPAEKATLLSAGISEAMNTTAYGLIMAIPALIMFALLSNRANMLIEDLNQGALRVYNWLSYAYEPFLDEKSRAHGTNRETQTSIGA